MLVITNSNFLECNTRFKDITRRAIGLDVVYRSIVLGDFPGASNIVPLASCKSLVPNWNGVYSISDLEGRQFYIGSSNNLSLRLGGHRRALSSGRSNNKYLQELFNQIGIDQLEVKYVAFDSILDSQVIFSIEQELLDVYCSDDRSMNIATNAFISQKGRPLTASHKQLLSTAHMGKELSIEHRLKLSEAHTGKALSDAHKLEIGKSGTGRITTERAKRLLRESAIRREARFPPEAHERSIQSRAVPVSCDGKVFPSYEEACLHFGITKPTLRGRLVSNLVKWSTWYRVDESLD